MIGILQMDNIETPHGRRSQSSRPPELDESGAANLKALSRVPVNLRMTRAKEMDRRNWLALLEGATFRAANLQTLSRMPDHEREVWAQRWTQDLVRFWAPGMDPNSATLLQDANARAANLQALSRMPDDLRETRAKEMDPNWAPLLQDANLRAANLQALSRMPDDLRETRAKEMDSNWAPLLQDANNRARTLSFINAVNLREAHSSARPGTILHRKGGDRLHYTVGTVGDDVLRRREELTVELTDYHNHAHCSNPVTEFEM
jgi:hypothetical protein